MAEVGLVFLLAAGELDPLSVDHDNGVAAIDMRGEDRFVFAPEAVGDDRS
jgi:hypothetical protein